MKLPRDVRAEERYDVAVIRDSEAAQVLSSNAKFILLLANVSECFSMKIVDKPNVSNGKGHLLNELLSKEIVVQFVRKRAK
jgi:hypothetical protein